MPALRPRKEALRHYFVNSPARRGRPVEQIRAGSFGGFARQLLVQHRGVVSDRPQNDGGLLEVFGLDAIQHVLIRMMGAATVIKWILNELEAGQANGIERK